MLLTSCTLAPQSILFIYISSVSSTPSHKSTTIFPPSILYRLPFRLRLYPTSNFPTSTFFEFTIITMFARLSIAFCICLVASVFVAANPIVEEKRQDSKSAEIPHSPPVLTIFPVGSIFNSVTSGAGSVFSVATSGAASVFTDVTSGGGAIATKVTCE